MDDQPAPEAEAQPQPESAPQAAYPQPPDVVAQSPYPAQPYGAAQPPYLTQPYTAAQPPYPPQPYGAGQPPPMYPPGFQPAQYDAVWPPPAGGIATEPVWFPFNFLYMRVKGSVSDFRHGMVGINPAGLILDGKMIPRAEIYTPIVLCGLILGIPGCIVASLILTYCCLSARVQQLPWETVQSVVFVPKKNRACIVFDAPNYAGLVKRFSLAFRLAPQYYPVFQDLVRQYGKDKAMDGKIVSASLGLLVVLAILVAILTIVFIAAALQRGK